MAARQKAADKAAAAEAERERKRKEDEDRKLAAEWSVGAKSNSKQQELEDKDAEKRRKAAEKAALLAAEDAELSRVKVSKAPKKKDPKDDFALLNAALSSQPKTKAQKEAEAKKKADEERLKKEEEAKEKKAARLKAQEDEIKKAAAKGIIMNHSDAYMVKIDNRPIEDEDSISATGLDAAVEAVTLGSMGGSGESQNGKALYKAYYSSRLPSMREEYPGLKLSQYQERIFEEWRTHPENPRNQKASRSDVGGDADGEV